MSSEQPKPQSSKFMVWGGYVVSALPVFGLIMSAYMKLSNAPPLVEGFKKFGFPVSVAIPLGIVELVCTLLYVIPQTAVLGAILLTGYLGGAVATHVRVSDDFTAPIVMGVMIWLGLFLRDARIRALVPWRR